MSAPNSCFGSLKTAGKLRRFARAATLIRAFVGKSWSHFVTSVSSYMLSINTLPLTRVILQKHGPRRKTRRPY